VPDCVKKIEKALRAMPGVSTATVHYAAGRIEVDHDPEQAPVEQLVETVRRAGFKGLSALRPGDSRQRRTAAPPSPFKYETHPVPVLHEIGIMTTSVTRFA